MEFLGVQGILVILFSFIIGVIFGGMAAFLSRRVMFNRQMRIAERKTSRMIAGARDESQNMRRQARDEASKVMSTTEAERPDERCVGAE